MSNGRAGIASRAYRVQYLKSKKWHARRAPWFDQNPARHQCCVCKREEPQAKRRLELHHIATGHGSCCWHQCGQALSALQHSGSLRATRPWSGASSSTWSVSLEVELGFSPLLRSHRNGDRDCKSRATRAHERQPAGDNRSVPGNRRVYGPLPLPPLR